MVREARALVFPKRMPIACLCSSGTGLNLLFDEARKLSKKEDFVLLLSDRNEILGRILPAYLNAYVRYREKGMRSESLQMELLLFIAGTFKISRAIEECGATGSNGFLLLCSNRRLLDRYARANSIEIKRRCKLGMPEGFVPVME